jgi:hypothetical protein
MKHAINSAYYGFQCEDDDDPILLRKEQEREVTLPALIFSSTLAHSLLSSVERVDSAVSGGA